MARRAAPRGALLPLSLIGGCILACMCGSLMFFLSGGIEPPKPTATATVTATPRGGDYSVRVFTPVAGATPASGMPAPPTRVANPTPTHYLEGRPTQVPVPCKGNTVLVGEQGRERGKVELPPTKVWGNLGSSGVKSEPMLNGLNVESYLWRFDGCPWEASFPSTGVYYISPAGMWVSNGKLIHREVRAGGNSIWAGDVVTVTAVITATAFSSVAKSDTDKWDNLPVYAFTAGSVQLVEGNKVKISMIQLALQTDGNTGGMKREKIEIPAIPRPSEKIVPAATPTRRATSRPASPTRTTR